MVFMYDIGDYMSCFGVVHLAVVKGGNVISQRWFKYDLIPLYYFLNPCENRYNHYLTELIDRQCEIPRRKDK